MENPLGFMIAALHDISNQLVQHLEEYLDPSAAYVVALEISKDTHKETYGQHFHVVAEMSKKQYDSFRKSILVNKMKLSGQARNGHPRQYGMIRNIRDETKLLSYTLKHNNYITKNIDLKTIQEYYQKSFIKKTSRDFVAEIMDYLLTLNHYNMEEVASGTSKPSFDFENLEKSILSFYINHDIQKSVSKATLKSLATRYLMYYHKGANVDEIYCYIKMW